MKKNFLIALIVSLFLLFSCKKQNDETPRKARGNSNTISVIIDDYLWNGEVGDLIRTKFASPVVGLPQEEPLFTINQYSAKLMEGFMTDNRIIIVVKKRNKNQFEIKKNQYAVPQNVFHISGKTNTAILEILEKNATKIIQISKETEIAESQKTQRQSLLNTTAIANKFGINIKVPSGYQYVLQSSKFTWLKKEIVSGNTSLLFYEVPINAVVNPKNPILNIIKIRDSIGNLYIRGTELDTQMITEEGYAPYFYKTKMERCKNVWFNRSWSYHYPTRPVFTQGFQWLRIHAG